MTRHDARVAAARAFSFREMSEMTVRAGWPGFGHARFLFCRQAVWLDMRRAGEIPVEAAALDGGLPSPA